MDVVRPLRLMVLSVVAVGCAACAQSQARTLPPVVMHVPPPPPRVAIPVSLPEPIEEPEAAPPTTAPASPARPPRETPPRTAERPAAPAPPAAAPETPTAVLQTTVNVGALEQRASWLLGDAEKNLERVNRGQLVAQERAQYDSAMSFIRNARRALQNKNFNYAEQLADKAAKLARALVKS